MIDYVEIQDKDGDKAFIARDAVLVVIPARKGNSHGASYIDGSRILLVGGEWIETRTSVEDVLTRLEGKDA